MPLTTSSPLAVDKGGEGGWVEEGMEVGKESTTGVCMGDVIWLCSMMSDPSLHLLIYVDE